MKILAVCGMGIGTGIVLKSNAERAAQRLGLDAEVEVADVGAAREAASTCDLVLTSEEFAGELGDVGVPIVVVGNFLDAEEIQSKMSAAVKG